MLKPTISSASTSRTRAAGARMRREPSSPRERPDARLAGIAGAKAKNRTRGAAIDAAILASAAKTDLRGARVRGRAASGRPTVSLTGIDAGLNCA